MGWPNFAQRGRRDDKTLPVKADPEPLNLAVDNAWKIHGALIDWTGKVDTKASFALAIEAAVLSGIIALTRPEQPLSKITSAAGKTALISGISLLGLGATLAILVVIPRIRSQRMSAEWRSNFIYFGHLRRWDPDNLSAHLQRGQAETLRVISRQLVSMSRIAWTKHRRVQASLAFAWLGVVVTVISPFI